ncbi:Detected protein of unknown function [Hibiscus syriacus]|uniref:protein-serine/threonine phosphatase n=1 Tax=Hibiscus syriacus TaxID=106335 RepID=A0A6A2WEH3_HIBSY|nr:Detected protein of unknown function [Hibiscus syriacus]
MGVYLSTPKTEKLPDDGENDRLRYGLSCMQGWRATMEDAHAASPDLDNLTAFFGVYDGHGGYLGLPGGMECDSPVWIANILNSSILGLITENVIPHSLREVDGRSQQNCYFGSCFPFSLIGKVVAKFCAKHLHQQMLRHEAYLEGDIGTSVQRAFLRMDEMMCGQRGWRELAVLGDKTDKISGCIEGFIWSPKSGEAKDGFDDWHSEEGPHSDFHGPTSGCTACGSSLRWHSSAGASCISYKLECQRKFKLSHSHWRCRVQTDQNLESKFDDDEFLVLAFDGIWDCMSSQQLVDYVREQMNSETKLSAICERAFNRCFAPTVGGEGCDNLTMILVLFKKPVGSGKPMNVIIFGGMSRNISHELLMALGVIYSGLIMRNPTATAFMISSHAMWLRSPKEWEAMGKGGYVEGDEGWANDNMMGMK